MNIYPIRASIICLVLLGLVTIPVVFAAGSETKTPDKTREGQTKAKDLAHAGKDLFRKNSCANCHSIDSKGGCLAPPLDGIRTRRPKKFILARITDSPEEIAEFSRLYPNGELMPHPRLSSADARKITAYLLTLPKPPGGFVAYGHQLRHQAEPLASSILAQKSDNDDISRGKALFYNHGCVSCHSIAHIGGQFAPALDGISQHREQKYIVDRITAAEFLAPAGADAEYQERGLVMPPCDLTEKEIGSIAHFLMSIP